VRWVSASPLVHRVATQAASAVHQAGRRASGAPVSGARPLARRRALRRYRSVRVCARHSSTDANPLSRHASVRPVCAPASPPLALATAVASLRAGEAAQPASASAVVTQASHRTATALRLHAPVARRRRGLGLRRRAVATAVQRSHRGALQLRGRQLPQAGEAARCCAHRTAQAHAVRTVTAVAALQQAACGAQALRSAGAAPTDYLLGTPPLQTPLRDACFFTFLRVSSVGEKSDIQLNEM
jgi:hypothetical protein